MTKWIPNAVTMINLACGCLATIYSLEGKYLYVLLLMATSLLADFADGLLARILNARSELGVQLDSLADAVSFGLVPGTILYVLLEEAIGRPFVDYHEPIVRLEHIGFLYTVFAVLRLGKFNIDDRQTDSFLGLATPAAALFVGGLLLIRHFEVPFMMDWLANEYLLIGITVALCALMISEIPMFSFKVNGLMWQGNQARVIFVVVAILLGFFLKWAALPAIILAYILISLIQTLMTSRY